MLGSSGLVGSFCRTPLQIYVVTRESCGIYLAARGKAREPRHCLICFSNKRRERSALPRQRRGRWGELPKPDLKTKNKSKHGESGALCGGSKPEAYGISTTFGLSGSQGSLLPLLALTGFKETLIGTQGIQQHSRERALQNAGSAAPRADTRSPPDPAALARASLSGRALNAAPVPRTACPTGVRAADPHPAQPASLRPAGARACFLGQVAFVLPSFTPNFPLFGKIPNIHCRHFVNLPGSS